MQTYSERAKDIFEAETESVLAVARLSRLIRSELTELDTLSRNQKIIEDELKAFLADYYVRILPLAETLERLNQGEFLQSEDKKNDNLSFSDGGKKDNSDPLEERTKTLYRKLVKAYHPDAMTSSKLPSAVHDIIEAYTERSVGTLWLLDIERECCFIDYDATLVAYLELQLSEITQMIETARARRQALFASDHWQLKERVFDAKVRGIDLIHAIACKIEAKIAAVHKIMRPAQENEAFYETHASERVCA